jgi:hypothetical protein
MYFLTACLIVVILSAAISFRRCRLLAQNPQGRLAAFLPLFSAAGCGLGLIGFDRVQGTQVFGFATTYLLMLIASFVGGWFLGIIGGLPDNKLP